MVTEGARAAMPGSSTQATRLSSKPGKKSASRRVRWAVKRSDQGAASGAADTTRARDSDGGA